jgi:hypothetical protein
MPCRSDAALPTVERATVVRLDDPQGCLTAPEAACVIRTDFQRGFINAEVVSFGDLSGNSAGPRVAGS